jgi:hypothetical protein
VAGSDHCHAERPMASGAAVEGRSERRSEPERRVEETDVLLREMVMCLSRDCPPHLLCDAAREELLKLTPHLQEALEALRDLEGRRGLTDRELAWQRAFRMLLDTSRMVLDATASEGRHPRRNKQFQQTSENTPLPLYVSSRYISWMTLKKGLGMA